MTQAKKDQDAVNEIVSSLAKRFGTRRLIAAVHAYAGRQAGCNDQSDWLRLAGDMEDAENTVNTYNLNP